MRRPSGKKVPDIDEVEDIIPDEGEEPKSVDDDDDDWFREQIEEDKRVLAKKKEAK